MNLSDESPCPGTCDSVESAAIINNQDEPQITTTLPQIELEHEKNRHAPKNNEDNIEMVYIRDVLLAQHPFLSEVENAVGRLTDSSNADMLNAEALSGLLDPDRILLEALRTLSDDPSMRKLQASLEVETSMINKETAAYQTIQTPTPATFRLSLAAANGLQPQTSSTSNNSSYSGGTTSGANHSTRPPPCAGASSVQSQHSQMIFNSTYSPMMKPPAAKRKKSCSIPSVSGVHKSMCGSSSGNHRVVKKREKTPPESQKLLKDWLFSHSHHPYPTDAEKESLCYATGLSLQQLNNWFINARRRILPNYILEQQRSPQLTP